MAGEKKVEIRRGLRDVYIDRTRSSFIDGKEGKLLYRGFNINDLAEHSTFEETAYLLLYGELPSRSELRDFDEQLKANRGASGDILDIIRLTASASGMRMLGIEPDDIRSS